MIDSDMIEHIIEFLAQGGRSVFLDTYQEKNYVIIRGDSDRRTFNDPDLKFEVFYNNKGEIANICGVDVLHSDPVVLKLKEAIKNNMKRAFKVKAKRKSLIKGTGNTL